MSCEEWLKSVLTGKDVVLCDDIRDMARAGGFSKKQLRDARVKLEVKTSRQFDEGASMNWFWYLEEDRNAGERD